MDDKKAVKNKKNEEAQEEILLNSHEASDDENNVKVCKDESEVNENAGSETESDCEKAVGEMKDKMLRLMAEFENFKKRTAREKDELFSSVKIDVVSAFIPVLDNLERALNSGEADEGNPYYEGVKMVHKQFTDTLSSIGVAAIKAVGESFDPNVHNAVMHVEDENYGENTIIEELMRGYILEDKVIRHSMVKVAN